MTRETKIGLLVGLAFIIVIGILLSDHLTQTNEPQQAQLAQVAGNVRTGVAVPGASATNPPPAAVAPQTSSVAPQTVIPTKDELTPPKPPVEVIQIGGGAPKSVGPAESAKPQAAPQTPQSPEGSPTVVARPTEPVNGSLNSVARALVKKLSPRGVQARWRIPTPPRRSPSRPRRSPRE